MTDPSNMKDPLLEFLRQRLVQTFLYLSIKSQQQSSVARRWNFWTCECAVESRYKHPEPHYLVNFEGFDCKIKSYIELFINDKTANNPVNLNFGMFGS